MDRINIVIFLIIISYALGSFGNIVGLIFDRKRPLTVGITSTFAGFILQTSYLIFLIVTNPPQTLLGTSFYFNILSWLTLFIFYALLMFKQRLRFLGFLAVPITWLLFLISAIMSDAQVIIPKNDTALFFAFHISTLLVASSILSLAFAGSIAFLYVERKIKLKKWIPQQNSGFSSLDSLDKLNKFAIFTSFPLFTIGLIVGKIWSFSNNNHVFFSFVDIVSGILWISLCVLFFSRLFGNFKGKKPALGTLVSFVPVVILLIYFLVFIPIFQSRLV